MNEKTQQIEHETYTKTQQKATCSNSFCVCVFLELRDRRGNDAPDLAPDSAADLAADSVADLAADSRQIRRPKLGPKLSRGGGRFRFRFFWFGN